MPAISSTMVSPETAQITRTQISPVASGPSTSHAVVPSVMPSVSEHDVDRAAVRLRLEHHDEAQGGQADDERQEEDGAQQGRAAPLASDQYGERVAEHEDRQGDDGRVEQGVEHRLRERGVGDDGGVVLHPAELDAADQRPVRQRDHQGEAERHEHEDDDEQYGGCHEQQPGAGRMGERAAATDSPRARRRFDTGPDFCPRAHACAWARMRSKLLWASFMAASSSPSNTARRNICSHGPSGWL